MQRYSRPPGGRPNFLPWIVALGVTAGLGYQFGPAALTAFSAPELTLPGLPSLPRLLPQPANQPSADEAALAADGFPVQARQHVYLYTAAEGDTLSGIAQRFAITPDTIFWSNEAILRDDVNLLRPGTELYILPVDGVYHLSDGQASVAQLAAEYGVSPGDILYSPYNSLASFDGAYQPPAGLRVVVPGGKRELITWQSPIRTGSESGRSNPEGAIHPGSCREQYTGVGGAGLFENPLGATPYRTTRGYANYHPGIDLSADERATPIYASETGVVVFAGWHRDGYGELIILDHGQGWTTYYAHLAGRYVDCGDQVQQGQIVGTMGSTGNASGIHLHFEIREGDTPHDPRDFIDFLAPSG